MCNAAGQLPHGYPAPPVVINDSALIEIWQWNKVQLKGISWPGFNNGNTMLDGLTTGNSSATTDFQAVAYQLKLLGFNAVRLPFTFDDVRRMTKDQRVVNCSRSSKSDWASRASDPQLSPQPDFRAAPEPPISPYVRQEDAGSCNSYLPAAGIYTIERLLWSVQYLIAYGFYVVVSGCV